MYPSFLIYSWGYSAITGNSPIVPQNIFFDALVLFPFWWMIIFTAQVTLFILLFDFLLLLIFPFTRKIRAKIFKVESYLIFLLVIFFLLYVPFRFWYDYQNISLNKVEISVKNLPVELENLKIVFISDTQADRYTNDSRLSDFVSIVNSLKADLVLVGGDIITSTPDYISTGAKYLGNIKSRYGVYSCVGDHDNWAYRNDFERSRSEVKFALLKNNVKMLDNESLIIPLKDFKLFLSFTTNTYMDKTTNRKLDSLAEQSTGSDFKIMITHQPLKNVILNSTKNNFDLILAGHTHGGQITFLFPFYNLSPTIFETKYLRGEFDFGKTKMLVCRGLGMSLAPVRYNSTPEILLIELKKQK
jgi:predicted MPP superfamily phosphohydrolase